MIWYDTHPTHEMKSCMVKYMIWYESWGRKCLNGVMRNSRKIKKTILHSSDGILNQNRGKTICSKRNSPRKQPNLLNPWISPSLFIVVSKDCKEFFLYSQDHRNCANKWHFNHRCCIRRAYVSMVILIPISFPLSILPMTKITHHKYIDISNHLIESFIWTMGSRWTTIRMLWRMITAKDMTMTSMHQVLLTTTTPMTKTGLYHPVSKRNHPLKYQWEFMLIFLSFQHLLLMTPYLVCAFSHWPVWTSTKFFNFDGMAVAEGRRKLLLIHWLVKEYPHWYKWLCCTIWTGRINDSDKQLKLIQGT